MALDSQKAGMATLRGKKNRRLHAGMTFAQ